MPSFPLMGFSLKNPVIVAAGPWSQDATSIQQSIDAGAAAVISETITMEHGVNHRPRIYRYQDNVFNLALYSKLTIEKWQREIQLIDRKGAILIASIWGSTPSETAYIAKKVENFGFDAIELSISAPLGLKSDKLMNDPEAIEDYVKTVVQAVTIPVMVKLSYATSLNARAVKAVEAGGAKAISAIDTLKGIKGVNLEDFTTLMPSLGGYGGPYLKPISLATIASLNQIINCDVTASGGIYTSQDVLEFLAMGSGGCQLASVILLNGYQVIDNIVSELNDWFHLKNIRDAKDICGKALQTLLPYEEIPLERDVTFLCKDEQLITPQIRQICFDQAIEARGINQKKCTGCGVCVETYPDVFIIRY